MAELILDEAQSSSSSSSAVSRTTFFFGRELTVNPFQAADEPTSEGLTGEDDADRAGP